MVNNTAISRRQFLKLTGTGLAALALPLRWPGDLETFFEWPSLQIEQLPLAVQNILSKVPRAAIGGDGYLILKDERGKLLGRAPQARTHWNLERTRRVDRLNWIVPWGIVLHWYGDKENFDRTVRGYLRGFDSLRQVEGEMIRTSAHFVVGWDKALPEGRARNDSISILQTQAPDKDGTPFLGSHLRAIDYLAHQERKQYFVRALYQLGKQEPAVHSLLQDFFDGPKVDPNLHTIAIEICGWDFESPEHYPSEQQIANVVALVWAAMKRYGIQASNLLGHHEIQLGKPDPGKKFMSLIRYLTGVKALIENDEQMKLQVFGQFLGKERDPHLAVQKYFKFVRDYLVMVGRQRQVFDWEASTKYWFLHDSLFGDPFKIAVANTLFRPIQGAVSSHRYHFLDPENHEGIDLYAEAAQRRLKRARKTDIHLVAEGLCLFLGETAGCRDGKTAIFRHRQPDGAEFLSVFGHLTELGEIQAGQRLPAGYRVGAVERDAVHRDPFLHYAVAYGATWDTDLSRRPFIPLNAGLNWIQDRYLNPVDYLQSTTKI